MNMKKILILISILLLTTTAVFGVYTDPQNLYVYGKILAGDITFKTEQTLAEASPVNLKTEPLVQPTGAGYPIGTWSFNSYSQESAKNYILTYDYTPLTITGTSIGIQLIEKYEEVSENKNDEATTTISSTAGNFSMERTVAFRLTAEGATTVAEAPASNNYIATVTLTVAAE